MDLKKSYWELQDVLKTLSTTDTDANDDMAETGVEVNDLEVVHMDKQFPAKSQTIGRLVVCHGDMKKVNQN